LRHVEKGMEKRRAKAEELDKVNKVMQKAKTELEQKNAALKSELRRYKGLYYDLFNQDKNGANQSAASGSGTQPPVSSS
jgi:hypothetical protein